MDVDPSKDTRQRMAAEVLELGQALFDALIEAATDRQLNVVPLLQRTAEHQGEILPVAGVGFTCATPDSRNLAVVSRLSEALGVGSNSRAGRAV